MKSIKNLTRFTYETAAFQGWRLSISRAGAVFTKYFSDKKYGGEKESFAAAEAALASLEQEPADLCIVDIRLPAMNGLSFISKAAERGLCKHFLVHTGSTDFHIDETLLKLNLSEADVFLKPCNLDDMLKRIREVL